MASLCFIDLADWDYNVDWPTRKPLGGSQSALCYLSMALAKAGHNVTVLSGTTSPGIVQNVECLRLDNCNQWFFQQSKFDAVIVLNAASYSKLRDIMPSSTRLVLWTQHETVQPAMRKLALPEVRDRWDAIVFVSDWQRSQYLDVFNVNPDKAVVLRNAIAPSFQSLFLDADDIKRAKSNPLTLAYTSTPYRGLHHLVKVFPEVKKLTPKARLDVYSSMAVYQKHEDYDANMFQKVYEKLRAVDGINYVGSLPQPALAERLAVSHILAYPNIFPETSCIAVMEAMAAGLRVVTTEFAALPETCEGFAYLVPPPDFNDSGHSVFIDNFTSAVTHPYAVEDDADDLFAQVVHMNQHHTWAVRARQWSEFLEAA